MHPIQVCCQQLFTGLGSEHMNILPHASGIQGFYKHSGVQEPASAHAGAARTESRGHCVTCSAARCSSLSAASSLEADGAGTQQKRAGCSTEPQPLHLAGPSLQKSLLRQTASAELVCPLTHRVARNTRCVPCNRDNYRAVSQTGKKRSA